MPRLTAIVAVVGLCVGSLMSPAVASLPPPDPTAVNYMTFFTPGSDEISSQGEVTINQVANAFKNRTLDDRKLKGKEYSGQIHVAGHTDLAESPQANVALSRARAEAVKSRLVALGVPSVRIVVAANGDTKPLVKTAPGVAEPQNRRVEIYFSIVD